MPTEKFRSKSAYMRNLAYRHIHGIPMTATKVCIQGRCHKVDHKDSGPERKKIDAAQKRKVARRKHGTSVKGKADSGSRKSSSKRRSKKGRGK